MVTVDCLFGRDILLIVRMVMNIEAFAISFRSDSEVKVTNFGVENASSKNINIAQSNSCALLGGVDLILIKVIAAIIEK